MSSEAGCHALRPTGWAGVVLAALMTLLAGCCPPESRFFHPVSRDFPTPNDVEDMSLTASDGAQLHAWFISAPSLRDGSAREAPAILFCHGSRTQIDALAPKLRPIGEQADASILLLSYRGYGRSEPTDCVTRATIVRDAHAALDALLDRDDVRCDSIGVLGYSFGGVAALGVARERGEIGAVAVGGTYSTARAALDDIGAGWLHLFVGSTHDPERAAEQLGDRPLLVFHGERDNDIPPYHARRIVDAARAGGTAVTFVAVPNATHFNVLDEDPELAGTIARFFETNLKPHDGP